MLKPFGDFYLQVDTTCAKNKSSRATTSTTSTTAESAIESKLLKSLQQRRGSITTSMTIDNDEEEVQIEAEFYGNSSTNRQTTQCATTIITPSSTSSSICSTTPLVFAPPPVKTAKRGRPFKLNLAAITSNNQNSTNCSPPVNSKRAYSATESSDTISGGPLNLSKRQSFERTETEMEMPPLLPIRQLKHYFQSGQQRREMLGSTGSGCEGETSSTETSPNPKDVLSDQADVFAEGVQVFRNGSLLVGNHELRRPEVESVDSENEAKLVGEPKISFRNNLRDKRVTGFEGLMTISEAIKLQKQQDEESKVLKRSEVFQPYFRTPEVSESSYCPHLATAKLPPLTLTDYANDQVIIFNIKRPVQIILLIYLAMKIMFRNFSWVFLINYMY